MKNQFKQCITINSTPAISIDFPYCPILSLLPLQNTFNVPIYMFSHILNQSSRANLLNACYKCFVTHTIDSAQYTFVFGNSPVHTTKTISMIVLIIGGMIVRLPNLIWIRKFWHVQNTFLRSTQQWEVVTIPTTTTLTTTNTKFLWESVSPLDIRVTPGCRRWTFTKIASDFMVVHLLHNQLDQPIVWDLHKKKTNLTRMSVSGAQAWPELNIERECLFSRWFALEIIAVNL